MRYIITIRSESGENDRLVPEVRVGVQLESKAFLTKACPSAPSTVMKEVMQEGKTTEMQVKSQVGCRSHRLPKPWVTGDSMF
jgi:hypothetical protein